MEHPTYLLLIDADVSDEAQVRRVLKQTLPSSVILKASDRASALENARRVKQEQQRRVELDRLNDALHLFADRLQGCRDETAIAQLLCETVRDALGWRRAVVSFRDYETMTSRPVAQVGFAPEIVAQQMAMPPTPFGNAAWMRDEFRVSHSYYVPDVPAALEPEKDERLTDAGGAGYPPFLLVVPLEAGGRILGLLSPTDREDRQHPTRQQIQYLELFAAQAAIAIESIRLSKSVRMWADAVRYSGDAIFVTDVEGRIVCVNPAFEALTGYRQAEVIGQSPRILKSGLTDPDIYKEMKRTLAAGKAWRGEVVGRRKDGAVYDADLTTAPIFGPGGEITGYVSSQRDISEVKALDRLKTQFVSNVSHELRTPLTNIRLYQHYLRERRRPDLRERFFDILDRETDRLVQIIEDLLDLSQLDSGAKPFIPALVDLNALIDEALVSYRAQAQELGITLTFEPAGALPPIMADWKQATRVLDNLVGNAINYTPGRGRVCVTTYPAEGSAVVRIRDNGYGIAPQEMDRIFDRFYRGEAARRSGAPGTGLGLAIVQQILDLHGGTIEVESKVGEGTTVTVAFPAAEGVTVTPATILVVEDDLDTLFLLQEQLKLAQYNVVLASTGEEALSQQIKARPDLIVLDLLLPQMDGCQVLEHLHSGEYGPAPPVLVITAADPTLAERALDLGAAEFLAKPYSAQVLLDTVRRLLPRRESRGRYRHGGGKTHNSGRRRQPEYARDHRLPVGG